MNVSESIERSLEAVLSTTRAPACPTKLGQAMRYAVFPGGARIRPRLSISVAAACHAEDNALVMSAASAIELMHCASLVHDDLPCFDDADIRRGKLSVHKMYGESTAVLVGDALIIMAFETLAKAFAKHPGRLANAILLLARNTGVPMGIAAGQGWEAENDIPLDLYHEAKTGALFAAATGLGAIAAGKEPEMWTRCGVLIGRAFQTIDDLYDVEGSMSRPGKPVQQDTKHNRPNIAHQLGAEAAVREAVNLIEEALAAVPDCHGRSALVNQWRHQLTKFLAASGKELQVPQAPSADADTGMTVAAHHV